MLRRDLHARRKEKWALERAPETLRPQMAGIRALQRPGGRDSAHPRMKEMLEGLVHWSPAFQRPTRMLVPQV